MEGKFYEYSKRLFAFEFGHLRSSNVVIFVGGLGDGFCTVPYEPLLSQKLNEIGWSLIQIQITSSYTGWGTGSLSRDCQEIAKLVNYLRSNSTPGGSRKHIGIMGHSTGCQDTINYFTRFKHDDGSLEFGILQAPVSDRFSAHLTMPQDVYDESLNKARELIKEGSLNEFMSRNYTKYFFNAPITAYRWNSLLSVKGDDDFFSPDLTDDDLKQTFGVINKPFLILYGGSDEYVPPDLDKRTLMERFQRATGNYWSPLSKIVAGAKHNWGEGSKKGAMEDGINTVVQFIQEVDDK